MYATNYYEKLILDALRGTTAQAPQTLYMALYLNNPGETGTGGVEVSYSGYARQPVTFSAPAPMNGGIGLQNVADITFPKSGVSLGAVSHVGVLDSQTGGNMLLYGEFAESITVDADEAPVIIAGEAQWWITGGMSVAYKTKVLNFLRRQSLLGVGTFLALFNGDPEDGGAELTGDNYARITVPFAAPTEHTGGQMQITNSTLVTSARATSAWGLWSYTAIFDEEHSGQPVYAIARTPKEVRKGMTIVVEPGALNLAVN